MARGFNRIAAADCDHFPSFQQVISTSFVYTSLLCTHTRNIVALTWMSIFKNLNNHPSFIEAAILYFSNTLGRFGDWRKRFHRIELSERVELQPDRTSDLKLK